MLKIIIIGGGIAGLSAATILCKLPNVTVYIYEKEKQLGGQASSEFTGNCFVEYSWRIFGKCYHNLMCIFNELGIFNNFEYLENTCFIEKDYVSDADLSSYNQLYKLFESSNISDYSKYFKYLFICKERALNEYRNVNAYEYFNKNPIMQTILGPFLGMDANKVSMSGALKNLYSINDNTEYSFTPKTSLITKNPTQESVFVPWKEYLIKNGVKIFLHP